MSVDSFIPEVWSARLLEHLETNLVYVNLLNRDYEGEIANYGDTVHIPSFGEVTVKDYTKNKDIDAPEDLSTTDQTLVIDQSKYFNFSVDNVDKVQMRAPLMDKYAANAAYGLKKAADTYAASLLKAGKIAKNAGLGDDTTPLTLDAAAKAYELLVDMQIALDNADVPEDGRWVVVPNTFKGLMEKDQRFVMTGTPQAENRLANGFAGRAAGFDIFTSNNVPNTGNAKYKIIASTSMCGTFAEQILQTEAYKPEKRFADAVKGLHVYGAKITIPEMVAVSTVNFTAAAQ